MTTHKDAQIVRRLRAYENETGPESARGLRDDAAWRFYHCGLCAIYSAACSC